MLVGEIERSETEKLHIELSNYKGRDFVSIRIYYLADNGEWRPTKKGVTVRPDQLDELVGILGEAKKKLPQDSEKQ